MGLRIAAAAGGPGNQWIRGHAGHEENEACDVLAVAARRQQNLVADEGFEDPEKVRTTLGLTLL